MLIPLALVCYLVICLTLLAHLPPSRSFPVERAIVASVVQPGRTTTTGGTLAFSGIGSHLDFFDWLRDTLLPLTSARRDLNHDKARRRRCPPLSGSEAQNAAEDRPKVAASSSSSSCSNFNDPR